MSFTRFAISLTFPFTAPSVASQHLSPTKAAQQLESQRSGSNHSYTRNRQKGFSLIELLVVVAVILIIAAMAVPNFIQSRMEANEASAVGSIRMINASATTYLITYPTQGYPASLATLSGPDPCNTPTSTNACLIDTVLAAGTKSGYTFAWNSDGNTPSVAYTITGTPIAVGTSGGRMFCSDGSGVIRFDPSGAGCTSTSTPLH